MAEVHVEVATYQVNWCCDECEKPMRPKAIVASDGPLRHLHACVNGHEAVLDERYPQIRYMELSDG